MVPVAIDVARIRAKVEPLLSQHSKAIDYLLRIDDHATLTGHVGFLLDALADRIGKDTHIVLERVERPIEAKADLPDEVAGCCVIARLEVALERSQVGAWV